LRVVSSPRSASLIVAAQSARKDDHFVAAHALARLLKRSRALMNRASHALQRA
jgi:hypothetical protein